MVLPYGTISWSLLKPKFLWPQSLSYLVNPSTHPQLNSNMLKYWVKNLKKESGGDLVHFMGKFVVEIIICSPFNYLKAHFTKQMDKDLKPHKRTTLRKSWNSNDLTLLSLFLRFKFFFLVMYSTISETK